MSDDASWESETSNSFQIKLHPRQVEAKFCYFLPHKYILNKKINTYEMMSELESFLKQTFRNMVVSLGDSFRIVLKHRFLYILEVGD